MKDKTKKNITLFAAVAAVVGLIAGIISFFIKREKKEVIHKGKKKLLYPQDLILEKTLLRLIPDFIKPTMISILRIILTPFAAYVIATGDNVFVPLGVYLLVSFTDMIDGALARTRDQITDIGKAIDPVADKLLFGFSAVFLLPEFGDKFLLSYLISLEIFLVLASLIAYRWVKVVASNIFGKIKMNLQVLGVGLYIIAKYTEHSEVVLIGKVILFTSSIFLLLSLLHAIIQSIPSRQSGQ